jgi:hypothetical protein
VVVAIVVTDSECFVSEGGASTFKKNQKKLDKPGELVFYLSTFESQ